MAFAVLNLGNPIANGAGSSISVPDNDLNGTTVIMYDGSGDIAIQVSPDGAVTWVPYFDDDVTALARIGTVNLSRPLRGCATHIRMFVSNYISGNVRARLGSVLVHPS